MVKKKKMPEANSMLLVLVYTHQAQNSPMAANPADISPVKHMLFNDYHKKEANSEGRKNGAPHNWSLKRRKNTWDLVMMQCFLFACIITEYSRII